MSGSLEINGKKLSSLNAVLKHSSYSRDYVTRLAREEKIVATQVGRRWYIDLDSLEKYETDISAQQKARQQKLSEERRDERLKKMPEPQFAHRGKASTYRHQVNTILATSVLGVGVMAGFIFQQNFIEAPSSTRQLANTSATSNKEIISNYTKNSIPPAPNTTEGSFSITAFSEIDQAVLLLPHVATGTKEVHPKELFSDEVSVVTEPDGQTYIVKKDQAGKETERIPYIIVPVSNTQTL